MSRSRKKHEFCKVVWKFGKQYANRTIRRFKAYIPNGCSYKKMYHSWDVISQSSIGSEVKKYKYGDDVDWYMKYYIRK